MRSKELNESELIQEAFEMKDMEARIERAISSSGITVKMSMPEEVVQSILISCRYRRMLGMAEYGTSYKDLKLLHLDHQIMEEMFDLINWAAYRIIRYASEKKTDAYDLAKGDDPQIAFYHSMIREIAGWIYLMDVHYAAGVTNNEE